MSIGQLCMHAYAMATCPSALVLEQSCIELGSWAPVCRPVAGVDLTLPPDAGRATPVLCCRSRTRFYSCID